MRNQRNRRNQAADITQDSNKPIKGTKTKEILTSVRITTVDRSKKTVRTWRNSHIQAESVSYPDRSGLYDLYRDLELDLFLSGLIEKRIVNVLNKKLQYKHKGEVVDEMDVVINSSQFRLMLRELLKTKYWGITGFEFEKGNDFSWLPIPRKHIKPKWQRITYEQTGTEGEDYTDAKNIWIISNDPKDLGMYLVCGFAVLLKKGVITDWANYIELFGLPTEVMEYEAGDEQTKGELQKIIDNRGSMQRMLVPTSAKYRQESVDGSNGNGQLQDSFINRVNQELSIYILGATENTSSSSSSGYAQSNTHRQETKEIIKADMIELINMLNTEHFANILRSYGFPVKDGGLFEFSKELDVVFLKEYAPIIKMAAVDMQLPISKKFVYDTLGIPVPAPDEELLEISETIDDEEEPVSDNPPAPKKAAKPKKLTGKQADKLGMRAMFTNWLKEFPFFD